MEATMSWTEITRPHDGREGMLCLSDMTGAEWALIAALMPTAKRIGWSRMTDVRAGVDAISYMASTG